MVCGYAGASRRLLRSRRCGSYVCPQGQIMTASFHRPETSEKGCNARVRGLGRLATVGVSCVCGLSAATAASGGELAAPPNVPAIVVGVSNVQSGPSRDLGHEL